MKRNINREKRRARVRRHERVRDKVHGTAARPRLCVTRSLTHIYAQIIDDESGRTLASASSLKLVFPPAEQPAAAPEQPAEAAGAGKGEKGEKGEKGGKGKKPARPASLKMRRSIEVGKLIAQAAIAKGIKAVAFDRGGY